MQLPASHHPATSNPWPHRLAWALACCTFPLIWFGGMVTTWRAGMAVPDWPSSFGQWFWLRLDIWFKIWDVFLEHSHRVLGMLAGLLTIALAVALWRWDGRRMMRWLGLAALVGVCLQGALGGLRVLANEVVLANIHGCSAPLFFALTATLVTLTSPGWRQEPAAAESAAARGLQRWTLAASVLIYVQIVLGAQIRHLLPQASLAWFQLGVWAHVLNAFAVAAVVALAAVAVRGQPDASGRLRRRLGWLIAAIGLQLLLGVLTWVTRYGWPAWAADYVTALNYTVTTGGYVQGLTVSAHVAVGSLALVAGVSLALWSRRLVRVPPRRSAERTADGRSAAAIGKPRSSRGR